MSKGWECMHEKRLQPQVSKGKWSSGGERKAVSKKILTPPGSCLQQAQPQAAAAGLSQLEQTLSEIQQPHQGKSRKKWGTWDMGGDGKQKQPGCSTYATIPGKWEHFWVSWAWATLPWVFRSQRGWDKKYFFLTHKEQFVQKKKR